MDQFINENKLFWERYQCVDGEKLILIEEPHSCVTAHILSVYSIMLNQAQGYKPVWRYNPDFSITRLKSYLTCAEFAAPQQFNFAEIVKMGWRAIHHFLSIRREKKILGFTYDGVKYGDIVYDHYLSQEKCGTINTINIKLLLIIFKCIVRHESTRKLLQSGPYEAVLVSHRVGISSGVMLRAALRYGCSVYSVAGQNRGTIIHSRTMADAISYEYCPSQEDIDQLLLLNKNRFDNLFKNSLDVYFSGRDTIDSQLAFSNENKLITSRQEFCKAYNLDPTRNNIFIMLHAFTDFPHSHFKWMIFKDYFDWFLQTLNYAKQNDTVNWIFKQHPSSKYYPIKNVRLEDFFRDLPSNIVYCSDQDKLDTRSLLYSADAIITCLGSAGYEMPAIAGIPAITAGDNFYSSGKFCENPTTIEEYYSILDKLNTIKKIDDNQQMRAQAAFIFIKYLSIVDMRSIPALNPEEIFSKNLSDEHYSNQILKTYMKNKAQIHADLINYIELLKNPDFTALRSTPDEIERSFTRVQA